FRFLSDQKLEVASKTKGFPATLEEAGEVITQFGMCARNN
ncbi:unnamed protein product, partial [marine sediment metagenome]